MQRCVQNDCRTISVHGYFPNSNHHRSRVIRNANPKQKGKRRTAPSLFSDESGIIRLRDNAMTNEGRRRALNAPGVRGAGILPTADLLVGEALSRLSLRVDCSSNEG